jgi:hypothetical protein
VGVVAMACKHENPNKKILHEFLLHLGSSLLLPVQILRTPTSHSGHMLGRIVAWVILNTSSYL